MTISKTQQEPVYFPISEQDQLPFDLTTLILSSYLLPKNYGIVSRISSHFYQLVHSTAILGDNHKEFLIRKVIHLPALLSFACTPSLSRAVGEQWFKLVLIKDQNTAPDAIDTFLNSSIIKDLTTNQLQTIREKMLSRPFTDDEMDELKKDSSLTKSQWLCHFKDRSCENILSKIIAMKVYSYINSLEGSENQLHECMDLLIPFFSHNYAMFIVSQFPTEEKSRDGVNFHALKILIAGVPFRRYSQTPIFLANAYFPLSQASPPSQ